MPVLMRRCHAELDRLTKRFGFTPFGADPVVFLGSLWAKKIAEIIGPSRRVEGFAPLGRKTLSSSRRDNNTQRVDSAMNWRTSYFSPLEIS